MAGMAMAVLVMHQPTAAVAAVMHGVFSGTITSGLDPTQSFGLPDLTGQNYAGTLVFDPAGFEPLDRVAGQYEYGAVYNTPNLLSVTLTINGQSRTVLSTYFARVAYDYPAGIHGITGVRFDAHPLIVDRVSSVVLEVFSATNAFLTPDGGITQSYVVTGAPSAAWFTVLADDQTTQYQIGMTVSTLAVEAPAPAALPILGVGLAALLLARRRPRATHA